MKPLTYLLALLSLVAAAATTLNRVAEAMAQP